MYSNVFLITLIFVFLCTITVIWVIFLIHPGTPVYRDQVLLDYGCLGLKVAANVIITLYQCTCVTSECEVEVLKDEVYIDGTYDSFRKMWFVGGEDKLITNTFSVNTSSTGYVTDGNVRISTDDCVNLTEDEYITCPRGKDLLRVGSMFKHDDGHVSGLVAGYGLIKLFDNGTVEWIHK